MIEREYQTFWPRFWAGWIDSLVFIPFMVIDHFLWEYLANLPLFVVVTWYSCYSLLWCIYSILMHGNYGQTLGKMAMRVVVLDISGNRLTMFQAIKRDFVLMTLTAIGVIHDIPKILTGISIYDPKAFSFDIATSIIMNAQALWFLVEIVTMLFNNKRRAIHDLIAGSVVMRQPQRIVRAN
jgi:uncharacterized RDD family membrane protein YckC